MEFAEIFAVEAGPQVCDQDLGALENPYPLSVEAGLIAEASKVLG
jgi:hypothetical protein